jgi:hypothetical protein
MKDRLRQNSRPIDLSATIGFCPPAVRPCPLMDIGTPRVTRCRGNRIGAYRHFRYSNGPLERGVLDTPEGA